MLQGSIECCACSSPKKMMLKCSKRGVIWPERMLVHAERDMVATQKPSVDRRQAVRKPTARGRVSNGRMCSPTPQFSRATISRHRRCHLGRSGRRRSVLRKQTAVDPPLCSRRRQAAHQDAAQGPDPKRASIAPLAWAEHSNQGVDFAKRCSHHLTICFGLARLEAVLEIAVTVASRAARSFSATFSRQRSSSDEA